METPNVENPKVFLTMLDKKYQARYSRNLIQKLKSGNSQTENYFVLSVHHSENVINREANE